MKFLIADRKTLNDGTHRLKIQVPREELVYLGYILESFEGWCNYTTPVKSRPIMQVDVAPDFIDDYMELFEFLVEWKIA